MRGRYSFEEHINEIFDIVYYAFDVIIYYEISFSVHIAKSII